MRLSRVQSEEYLNYTCCSKVVVWGESIIRSFSLIPVVDEETAEPPVTFKGRETVDRKKGKNKYKRKEKS